MTDYTTYAEDDCTSYADYLKAQERWACDHAEDR